MSPRIVALSAIAAAVAGLGVYLLIEVQAGSATADPVTTAAARHAPDRDDAAVTTPRPSLVPNRPARPAFAGAEATPADDTPGRDAGSGSDAGSAGSAAVAVVAPTNPRRPHLFTAPGHGGSKAKVDHMLDESARAYDAGNFERAKAIAGKILSRQPDNTRAIGILAVTACAQNDASAAQGYYNKLPVDQRAAAKASCSGIQLQEP
nr:tetratricopeptide repeat protein [Kofleriaceae bacterium]